MSTIIICEKPNQNIQAAIGSSFGVIYAAAGHILKLTWSLKTSTRTGLPLDH